MEDVHNYRSHEEFINRSRKLEEIKALGVEPYPHSFYPTHSPLKLHEEYSDGDLGTSEDAAAGTTLNVCVAGRLVLFRAMGKNAFAQLQGETSRIQIMFNRENTVVTGYDPEGCGVVQAPKPLKFLEKKLDLGDIIGVEGHIFRTQKGELTVYAKKVPLLCKTLLPLADKHAGLADKEVRYRKRWLDLITHDDVMKTFITRSAIVRTIRRCFEDADFTEVETPVMQNIYGGAQARPFKSHCNALDQEMFLRISPEISLKKLIIGGMDKIYEIGKVFRNEGIDKSHNPEFTILEAYASYWDYNDMMSFVEKLFETLALELYGDTKVPVGSEEEGNLTYIEMKAPWRRVTMKDSIKEYGGVDVEGMDDDALRAVIVEKSAFDADDVKDTPRGLLIPHLFEELVEDKLIQPHHITDHPIETTPLCKPHRDPKERADGIVERFESFMMGREMCNAYTELNDPVIQKDLLEDQASRLASGDEEANPLDEEFIEAICQGMPPTSGVGIGIDRLVMVFTNAASIRDVLFFPFMKKE